MNDIGEAINEWSDAVVFYGWLGMQSGDSKYSTYDAKIAEASHVLVCDFDQRICDLSDQNTRVVIKGKFYDVTYIDNPDELDEHLEIYLRFVGGQNG